MIDETPRVPRWVRVPAVVLGGKAPWKQLGTAVYERLLDGAVVKFMRTGFLSYVYLRGGAARGDIHPGLSDLDLILVSPYAGPGATARQMERLEAIIEELKTTWHPVNDVAWLFEDEEKLLRQFGGKRPKFWFQWPKFKEGRWTAPDWSNTHPWGLLEAALEAYECAFYYLQLGLRKNKTGLLTLAHAEKHGRQTDYFLGRAGFPPIEKGLPLLNKLAVQLRQLDELARNMPQEDLPTGWVMPVTAESHWMIGTQKFLLKRFLASPAAVDSFSIPAANPFCFLWRGHSPEALEKEAASFLKFCLAETQRLAQPVIAPLLTPALLAHQTVHKTLHSNNRKYLFGKGAELFPVPAGSWEFLLSELICGASQMLTAKTFRSLHSLLGAFETAYALQEKGVVAEVARPLAPGTALRGVFDRRYAMLRQFAVRHSV